MGRKAIPGLTPAQGKVLAFIAAFTAEHNYPPSWRDISKHIGASSTNAAHDHIHQLIKKGFLTKQPHICRTLTLTPAGRHELVWSTAEVAERRQLG
jgi:SOS-response transcriptional repressor LexA